MANEREDANSPHPSERYTLGERRWVVVSFGRAAEDILSKRKMLVNQETITAFVKESVASRILVNGLRKMQFLVSRAAQKRSLDLRQKAGILLTERFDTKTMGKALVEISRTYELIELAGTLEENYEYLDPILEEAKIISPKP